MSTKTQTATQTVSITAGDVRQVMSASSREMRSICKKAAHAAPDFDADAAEKDLALLALQAAISKFSLQFYKAGELVCEYSFVICDDGSLTNSGSSEDASPTGYIPEGTRIRLTATPNPEVPKEHSDHWFDLLGWSTAKPLILPSGVTAKTYGSFASGSFGLQRQLLVNPKFDKPVTPSQNTEKGKNR